MNLLPSPEQDEIISAVRQFLASRLSVRRYQDAANRGAPYPADLWQALVELGWFGIGVAEGGGGLGLGLADEVLLAREAGRQLVSPTVLGTAFATQLAAAAGRADLTRDLIGGKARVALALPAGLQTTGDRVSGTLAVFDDGEVTHVVAGDADACYLFARETLGPSSAERCTDESLGLDRLRLDDVRPLARSDEPRVHSLLALMLAAAQAGIAEATRDAAVSYARERVQFGQPIGSFQAISHLCADMAVLAEAAWAQCVYAALSLDDGIEGSLRAVASAAALAERAALENSRSNIQVHGGVGFTVEYDAHYFAKRSHVYRQLGRACLSTLGALVPR